MILYTDGGCHKNGSPDAKASWAFLEHDNGQEVYHAFGRVPEDMNQTNNVGELLAIKNAMQYAYEKKAEWCVIFTDSLYALNSIMVWDVERKKKGGVANYELIKICQRYLLLLNFQIQWVRGHDIDYWNDKVDGYATQGLSICTAISLNDLK